MYGMSLMCRFPSVPFGLWYWRLHISSLSTHTDGSQSAIPKNQIFVCASFVLVPGHSQSISSLTSLIVIAAETTPAHLDVSESFSFSAVHVGSVEVVVRTKEGMAHAS